MTMERVTLTDRYIASPARVPKSGRREYKDTEVRGLRLRVSEYGYRSFVLLSRFPPSLHPTRRSIGPWPEVSVDQARDTALQWRRLLRDGIDPAVQQRKAKAAALVERQRTEGTAFRVVAEAYLLQHVSGLKSFAETAAQVRWLATRWGAKPIGDITSVDCEEAIKAVKVRAQGRKNAKDGSGQARRYLSVLRHMFHWAMGKPEYRLDKSPMDRLDFEAHRWQSRGTVTRPQRRRIAARLAGSRGHRLSVRAIGADVGVDRSAVARDCQFALG